MLTVTRPADLSELAGPIIGVYHFLSFLELHYPEKRSTDESGTEDIESLHLRKVGWSSRLEDNNLG